MKRDDSSPWDRPFVPDGPRIVGDDGGAPAEEKRSSRGVDLPGIGDPSGTRPPVEPAVRPSKSAPGPSRNTPWGKIAAAIVAVAAVVAIVVGGISMLSGRVRGFDVEHAARSVVVVYAPDCGWAGSGSIISADGLVLTNSHVATDEGADVCSLRVGLTDSYDAEPSDWYPAEVVVDDVDVDIAVIRVLDQDGGALHFTGRDPIPINTATPQLGDVIQTLGYPGLGGNTMTFTSGDYAGIDTSFGSDFYKTTASLNHGVSGGAAFNGTFALIGIPTAGRGLEVVCEGQDCSTLGDSIGLIRPIRYAVPLIEQAKERSK